MDAQLDSLSGITASRLSQSAAAPWLAALVLFDPRSLALWAARFAVHCPGRAARLAAQAAVVAGVGAAAAAVAALAAPRGGGARCSREALAAATAAAAALVGAASLRREPAAPLVLRPVGPEQASPAWLAQFVEENRKMLQSAVDRHGALLFRGFGLADAGTATAEALDASVRACEGVLEAAHMRPTKFFGQAPRKQLPGWRYLFRNVAFESVAPSGFVARAKLAAGVVWSRAPSFLTFHHEMAYLSPENHLGKYGVFFCPKPSSVGGFTPLSDARRVLRRLQSTLGGGLPTEMRWVLARKRKAPVPLAESGGYLDYLLGNFELADVLDNFWPTRRVIELRKLAGELGLELEETDTEFVVWSRWINPSRPLADSSGEITWWANGNHMAVGSQDIFGRPDALKGLPFEFKFADGSVRPASMAEIIEISLAWWQEAAFYRWAKGDLLIFNNQVVAHNATPGLGKRMVLPSFGDCW